MSPGLGGELRVFSTGPSNLDARYHGNLKRHTHIGSHAITQSCVESCQRSLRLPLKAAGVRALSIHPPPAVLMKPKTARVTFGDCCFECLLASLAADWHREVKNGMFLPLLTAMADTQRRTHCANRCACTCTGTCVKQHRGGSPRRWDLVNAAEVMRLDGLNKSSRCPK